MGGSVVSPRPQIGLAAMALVAAIVGAFVMAPVSNVEARPNYKKEWEKKFPKVKGVNCEVCHAKGDKKKRNDYGKAVGEALDGEKVMEKDKILEAFEKANKKDSKVEGKTFGDLIKEGKKPVQ
jgi:hypothetical protein